MNAFTQPPKPFFTREEQLRQLKSAGGSRGGRKQHEHRDPKAAQYLKPFRSKK